MASRLWTFRDKVKLGAKLAVTTFDSHAFLDVAPPMTSLLDLCPTAYLWQ